MTTTSVTLRAYRVLIRLYPRSFRDEYGPDLVGLVADQLRDEPFWRVASRNATDLVLTLPTRHLEAHMDRSPTLVPPILFGAITLAATIVAVVVGHPLVFLACLAIAVIAGALGLLALHRARPLNEPRPVTDHWWKALGAGAGLLVALIAITRATGELSEGAWFIATTTGLLALVLIGTGIVLGVARMAVRSPRGFAG